MPGVDQGPVCFRAFPSDVEAAAYFISVLTKGHWPVVAAMEGSPEDVARAMRVPPAYYAGPAGTEDEKAAYYAKAITNAIHAIGSSPPPAASASGISLPVVTGLALAGWAAWRWYSGQAFLPSFVSRRLGLYS